MLLRCKANVMRCHANVVRCQAHLVKCRANMVRCQATTETIYHRISQNSWLAAAHFGFLLFNEHLKVSHHDLLFSLSDAFFTLYLF